MMRPRRMFGTVLPIAALLCSAFVWTGCRGMLSEDPPVHLNPNMDQQSRINPQEPSEFFKDKRGMRLLVPGTVARPLHITSKDRDSRFLQANDHLYRGYKEVSVTTNIGGKVSTDTEQRYYALLPQETPLTAALLKRGQERYNIYCAVCHGHSGNGQGVVTLYEKSFIPRNLHGARVRGMRVGEIYKTISEGSGKMNALRSAIPTKDRWAIVAYVRALQISRINTSSR